MPGLVDNIILSIIRPGLRFKLNYLRVSIQLAYVDLSFLALPHPVQKAIKSLVTTKNVSTFTDP